MYSPFVQRQPAVLALADGSVFRGVSIGADGQATGEVVFNTSVFGYQELLTDPSYRNQILLFTYPHIGNTGVNLEDDESAAIQAAGVVIKDLSICVSNFRSTGTLSDYLRANGKVAIAGIDTRRLTRIIRDKGTMPCAIVTGDDAGKAVALAQSAKMLNGIDTVKEISCAVPYEWTSSKWVLGTGYEEAKDTKRHVVAIDLGAKYSVLRILASHGNKITVVPANTSAADILALNPDGVFLTNGPGDPNPVSYAAENLKGVLASGIPVFGLGMGCQILGMACGAKVNRLKIGQHGGNYPVRIEATKTVMITVQNHCYAVDAATLPSNCRVTHTSLFDGSLQGFERTDVPAFGFQGHPGSATGPSTLDPLFERFNAMMDKRS